MGVFSVFGVGGTWRTVGAQLQAKHHHANSNAEIASMDINGSSVHCVCRCIYRSFPSFLSHLTPIDIRQTPLPNGDSIYHAN